jgi:hypothetical protein
MNTDHNNAVRQAAAQYSSIRQFILALDLDFDRLQELRDLRDDVRMGEITSFGNELWLNTYPNEAKELASLEKIVDGYCWKCVDDVIETIEQDPLDVSVGYSGWYRPGEKPEADTYRILLCTGGPAVQITGRLDDNNEPDSADLQWQDWGTPWSHYFGPEVDNEVLMRYVRYFYFGEA